MFYNDISGIVFVIDGTDKSRMNIVKESIAKLDKDLDRKIPIVFLANKQDVDGALNKSDIKTFLDLDKLDSNFIWTTK
jgi:signal recognition particle receptor subunit beta